MSQVLYVKGMNNVESEEEEDDIWDDTKLDEAYERAIEVANAEVAKRIALATNTKHHEGYQNSVKKKTSPKQKDASSTAKVRSCKKSNWMVGMPCRALYKDDGCEYEAILVKIVNEQNCIIRFLGYDNSEVVRIDSLKESKGNAERAKQIQMALNEEEDDVLLAREYLDSDTDLLSSESAQKTQKTKKKKQSRKDENHMKLPNMPFPNMPSGFNLSSMDCPIPPPPLCMPTDNGSDDQAISSMLLSWYMSGYYTGLYQGMKRARSSK